MKNGQKIVLGIESTCDETGVGIVAGTTQLLGDVTATSLEQHARYGGVIPEIASRAHLEAFLPTLQEALSRADILLEEVDAIACAAGPGLVGSLSVGISAAKALAVATGLPLYGVNHVIGHLAVDQLAQGKIELPAIGLVVSGGHSNLLLVKSFTPGGIEELGGTLDDAAGEAFDKVGRLLGLPYPGGPYVDKAAARGNKQYQRFPRGLSSGKYKESHPWDFSFSGLKTAVARHVEALEAKSSEHEKYPGRIAAQVLEASEEGKPWLPVDDICAAFSEAVIEPLVTKSIRAALTYGCQTIVVGGGFSANSRLRGWLEELCKENQIELRLPPLKYCTDNGAQIAALGAELLAHQVPASELNFGPDSSLPLTEVML